MGCSGFGELLGFEVAGVDVGLLVGKPVGTIVAGELEGVAVDGPNVCPEEVGICEVGDRVGAADTGLNVGIPEGLNVFTGFVGALEGTRDQQLL